MYNITTAEEINATFAEMADVGFGPDNAEVEAFGKIFFADLTPEHKKLYHYIFPPKPFANFNADAHSYEGKILAAQEKTGYYD